VTRLSARSSLALLLLLPLASCQRGGAAPQGTEPALPGITAPDAALVARLAEALKARGAGYVPRTRHLLSGGAPKYTNRLVLESSPYLQQHAHNPVNWFPWGDEAFDRALREGKPVFLSIGYSTCHWCHVMEEESFEDVEIATLLNERFVAVKVDREERPDVDSIYMGVLLQLSGRGGWPMTLLLTPRREPFFAASYLPARDGDRGARTGLLTLLREVDEHWRKNPAPAAAAAAEIAARLRESVARPPSGPVPGPEAIRHGVARLAEAYDRVNGGFGLGPKFPTPPTLALLARYHRRTGDVHARKMLVHTLDRMAAGGIHDQIGGGFHRYSVDDRWLVPHFEKMLYDNALLVLAYLDGHQLDGRAGFDRVARRALDYLAREMSDPRGGFFSATDADSPVPGTRRREEGFYFTWTPREARAVLGKSASLAITHLGVTAKGDLDGRSVLRVAVPVATLARRTGRPAAKVAAALDLAKEKLRAAREKRPPPLRDEKVLAAWNGLAISAFARASLVLGAPAYAERAARAADFVLAEMRPGGDLRRVWKDGMASQAGLLDDHAFLAQGLLDLHEATQDPRWLQAAIDLQGALEVRFWDESAGGFFQTPHEHEELLAREKPVRDGAEPSGNAIAILNLLRLEELTTLSRYGAMASRALGAFASELGRGAGAEMLLAALDFHLDSPLEIVVVSPPGGGGAELEAVLRRAYLPNRILVKAREGPELSERARLIPLLTGKTALRGATTAYVCRERTCELPTSDPRVFAQQLARVEPLFGEATPAPLPGARAR